MMFFNTNLISRGQQLEEWLALLPQTKVPQFKSILAGVGAFLCGVACSPCASMSFLTSTLVSTHSPIIGKSKLSVTLNQISDLDNGWMDNP